MAVKTIAELKTDIANIFTPGAAGSITVGEVNDFLDDLTDSLPSIVQDNAPSGTGGGGSAAIAGHEFVVVEGTTSPNVNGQVTENFTAPAGKVCIGYKVLIDVTAGVHAYIDPAMYNTGSGYRCQAYLAKGTGVGDAPTALHLNATEANILNRPFRAIIEFADAA